MLERHQTSFGVYVCTLCFPSDASLTLLNALDALTTVQDVGGVLDMSYTMKKDVLHQSTSDEERRERLLSYFLHTHPNASWEWLGGQLLLRGEYAAMQEVKVYIKPNEGVYSNVTSWKAFVKEQLCRCPVQTGRPPASIFERAAAILEGPGCIKTFCTN